MLVEGIVWSLHTIQSYYKECITSSGVRCNTQEEQTAALVAAASGVDRTISGMLYMHCGQVEETRPVKFACSAQAVSGPRRSHMQVHSLIHMTKYIVGCIYIEIPRKLYD